MPAVIYDNTFALTGSGGDATVHVQVDWPSPAATPTYVWTYTVRNVNIGSNNPQDYINSDSQTSFWLNADIAVADARSEFVLLSKPSNWGSWGSNNEGGLFAGAAGDTTIYFGLYAGANPNDPYLGHDLPDQPRSATFSFRTAPRLIAPQPATFGDDTFGDATGEVAGPGAFITADVIVTGVTSVKNKEFFDTWKDNPGKVAEIKEKFNIDITKEADRKPWDNDNRLFWSRTVDDVPVFSAMSNVRFSVSKNVFNRPDAASEIFLQTVSLAVITDYEDGATSAKSAYVVEGFAVDSETGVAKVLDTHMFAQLVGGGIDPSNQKSVLSRRVVANFQYGWGKFDGQPIANLSGPNYKRFYSQSDFDMQNGQAAVTWDAGKVKFYSDVKAYTVTASIDKDGKFGYKDTAVPPP